MDKVRAVIFDLYGTLLKLNYNRYAKSSLKQISTKEKKKKLLTTSYSCKEEFLKELSETDDIIEYQRRDLEDDLKGTNMFPEIEDVLYKLKSQGYTLGVLSNLATPFKEPFYRVGLDTYIDEVGFSCDSGDKKPSLSFYSQLQSKLDYASEEILMIGDSFQNDYIAAKNCGWQAFFLDRRFQSQEEHTIRDLYGVIEYLNG